MVVSSRMEGGANVVSEAVIAGLPVIASAIPGNLGLLGEDYPGVYPVGDRAALARLLRHAETDPAYLALLRRRCAERAPLFTPEREATARSEEHTSELQSLMRISYAVFCLKKQKIN